jgi:YD repeat-containing protein
VSRRSRTGRRRTAREDEIRYGGFGGASRTILVRRQRLRECLVEGEQARTYAELFPSIAFAGASAFDPLVACAVDLPNGTSYDFAYNAYGELARVTLPTGGRFEYEWGSGVDDSPYGLVALGSAGDGRTWSWAVLRRVTSRKVYNYGQLEQWTEYDAAGCQLGDCRMDVRHLDADGRLVRLERHFFGGNPRASFSLEPCDYPAWTDGRETGAEVSDGAGNLLRRVENTWAQRAPLPWRTPSTEIRGEPPNDVRLTRAATTLEDGRSSSVRYQHDDYNNVKLREESDYGGGVARTTTRGFVAGAYASEPVHIRNLPAGRRSHTAARRSLAPTSSTTSTCRATRALLERPGSSSAGRTWVRTARGEPHRRATLAGPPRPLHPSTEALTRRRYDVAGNPWREIDPRAGTVTWHFDDNCGRADGSLGGGVDHRTFARVTLVRDALGHETRTQFDYETGGRWTSATGPGW